MELAGREGLKPRRNRTDTLKKDLEEHLSSTSSMLDPNTFPQLDESAQKTRLIWHKGSDGGLFQQPALMIDVKSLF